MTVAWRWRADQLRTWLEEVERTWLGWSFPPAARALTEAGWKRNDRSAYCGRCGTSVGPGEATDRGCGSCRDVRVTTDGLVRLGAYTDELRAWILDIKYQRWAEMAEALGRQLGTALGGCGLLAPGRTVVVPMPMPWQRRVYRGIDHARLIAAAVAAELHAPLLRVLVKANGPPQVALPASQRQRHAGRMRVRRRIGRWRLNDLHVVLIDDVRTTGASLRAATRLLRRFRADRVIAGVLAVSDDRARRTRARHGAPAGEQTKEEALAG